MYKIKVKNLRSLNNTGEIDIKPLTVVVGKNSSGKSTLLRFFPLIKQTLETRRNEPILWYSDRYVDFGSYKEAFSKNAIDSNEECIEFSLTFEMYKNDLNRINRLFKYNDSHKINGTVESQITLKVKAEYIDLVKIKLGTNNIDIKFKNKSQVEYISINDTQVDSKGINGLGNSYARGMIPELILIDKSIRHYFTELICERIEKKYSGKFYEGVLEAFIDRTIDKVDIESELIISKLDRVLYTEFNEGIVDEIIPLIEDDTVIKNYILGCKLEDIIRICNIYFEEKFMNVKYIAPVRANAERYYRVQGLAIDEMDSRGENIAMMLYNLNDRDKRLFNDWVKSNFGFEVQTSSEGGHVSIKIKQYNSNEYINLVDTGFGYSQILPIIVQLWKITKTTTQSKKLFLGKKIKTYILVIEQPELHLHPYMQGNLVDAFIKVLYIAKKQGIDLKIIIETHSESIINRIGEVISSQEYDNMGELVNLLIFDKNNEYETEITRSGYDDEGYLKQWPIGFFDAGE